MLLNIKRVSLCFLLKRQKRHAKKGCSRNEFLNVTPQKSALGFIDFW